LDTYGRLVLPEELSVSSDAEALKAAQLMKFQKCEIWQGRRLVASLNGQRLVD
jgi:hypothetical protein